MIFNEDGNATQKRVFYFPYVHVNQYVDISKQLIGECGFDIKNFKKLFHPKNVLRRKDNVAVLNWYEDRPYQKRFSKNRAFLECFVVWIQLLLMPVLASKIIWVRHNFKPHNRLKRPFTHRINCSLLKLISNRVVTLEKVSEFDSTLIPHPLYEDDHTLLTHIDSFSEEKNANSFLFFGTIKPYKKLEILLNAWPKLRQLRIVGYCQDEKYFKELQSIIEQRKLFVEWTNEYVSDEYLEHLLSKTRYVIMPHDDGAMISSGSFYQAINFGANVICFDSDFARKKANLHRFVHIVASPNMDEFLTELPFVATKQVMREAFESYGRKKIHCSWKQLLKPE